MKPATKNQLIVDSYIVDGSLSLTSKLSTNQPRLSFFYDLTFSLTFVSELAFCKVRNLYSFVSASFSSALVGVNRGFKKYVFAGIKRKSILFSIKSLVLLTALATILVLLTAITVSATVYSPWTREAVDTTSTTDIQCAKVGDANYTQEQDFTWGVLAINTHKSIYLPNEAASIGIAVLDKEGHMICDADVTLTITDPGNNVTVLSTSNGLINVSPQCCVYGVTNLPDFYTNYTVGGAGTYVMHLTAVTADGTKSITDVFTVQNSVDFEVARDGATRIYPPVPYVMNFTINANKDYDGLIREYVPASFVITPQEGLIVTTVGDTDTKILTWTRNLVEGETYNIYYEFDAPDVSPYLFVLGALEIGGFKEVRQWQIASDASATETLYVNGIDNTYTDWTEVGDSPYLNNNDANNIYTNVDENKEGEFRFADPSGSGTINSVTIYFECRQTAQVHGSENFEPFLYDGSSWTQLTDVTPDEGDPYTWKSEDVSTMLNTWTKITNAEMYVVYQRAGGPNVETIYIRRAYIYVDYTPTWESYKEKQHNNEWGTEADPYDRDTHVVYMYGEGFKTSHDYKVAYYDANGNKAHEDTDSSKQGALSSQYDFTLNSGAAAGTWHSVVLDTTDSAPNAYDAAIADPTYVIDDDFEVDQSAIPEPTWESYKEQQHNTVWGTEADPYDRDTHVVFMYGEGFKTSHDYKVAYYDANGNKAHEVTDSSKQGALSSEYDFTENSGAAAGTWHSVVLDTTGSAPNAYDAAIEDPNYVIDDNFVVSQSAIREPTWESYKEEGHINVWGTVANPYDSDYHVVYMYGQWFETSHSYKVGYYDGTSGGGGHLVSTYVGGSSTEDGEFSSQCECMSTGAVAGTWHAVVFDTSGNIPNTYSAAIKDANYVTDDDFEVAESAIPEFPTVIAAIAVCMLCAVSYMVMRRNGGKG